MGADVCADLITSGAADVTMLQRSSTLTVLPHDLKTLLFQTFTPGGDVELDDFCIASVLFRGCERLTLEEKRNGRNEGDMERMRRMKVHGFLVDHGPGKRGLYSSFSGGPVFVNLSSLLGID
jgi:hypothetical protein